MINGQVTGTVIAPNTFHLENTSGLKEKDTYSIRPGKFIGGFLL